MKINLTSLFSGILILLSSCIQGQENPGDIEIETSTYSEVDTFPILERMQQKAISVKEYLKQHPSYNQNIAILIDMRQHSGKNRLFVYNMDSISILSKGLVSHGSGSETGIKDSLKFSNVPQSYTSSLGKYKIGFAYVGSFGRSYKLHGLEASNNKAFERAIVLHRYSCVPDTEQYFEICNSLGCPMVSESYFLELDKLITNSKKPIILEIFY